MGVSKNDGQCDNAVRIPKPHPPPHPPTPSGFLEISKRPGLSQEPCCWHPASVLLSLSFSSKNPSVSSLGISAGCPLPSPPNTQSFQEPSSKE